MSGESFMTEDIEAFKERVILGALHQLMLEYKLTIRATSGAELLITNQETGEEYIIKDLGYPI